jgi:hypothetical protein
LVKRLSTIALLFLVAIIPTAWAKSALRQQGAAAQFAASRSSGTGLNAAVRAFESTLTPYLRARISNTVSPAAVYVPSQADYLTLAKYWSHFSRNFMDLYAKAVGIPPKLLTYNSPGGHFQIIYSISGRDSVDKTDTIGYSTVNWRTRQHTGNGVPDYVELVAYAADSAWSMEIDRFEFVQPFPYIDTFYTSSRFKIYVRHASDPRDYALTYPDGKMSGTIGFRSHIEIRNEWDSFGSDYAVHPEKAVQVTCAHEFFHTVQYAMTREVVYDYIPEDFPVSWVEGSAVLMEDCGFNYVHDYLQYLDAYFNDPTATVLEPSDDNTDVYKNSIVTLFLFQQTADTPCICFIKNMFFNDYQHSVGFLANLRSSAATFGHAWTDLLGNFHSQSYYSGSRAVNGRFIKDAGLMPQWDYNTDGAGGAQLFTKTVRPFAMNTFSFLHRDGDVDKLKIGFLGDSLNTGETDTNAIWSVHCILKKDTVPADDSVFEISKSSLCRGRATIDGWHLFTEALLVVTNGRYDNVSRSATVTFEACATTIYSGETATFSAAGQPPSNAPKASVTVKANADLLCTLTIAGTTISKQMTNSATGAGLSVVGAFFNLTFPLTWLNDASMNLSLTEPLDSLHSGMDTASIPDSAVSLYRWNSSLMQWNQCTTTSTRLADSTIVFACPVNSSGIFGLFGRQQDTTSAIFVFPNPARLKSNGAITFRGKEARDSLLEIWIYTIDGSLLAHGTAGAGLDPSLGKVKYGFSWKLRNNRGQAVSPGVYYAYVGSKDLRTKGMRKKAQKLFVVP